MVTIVSSYCCAYISTSLMRCSSEKPETGWSEEFSTALFGRKTVGVDAGFEARALLDNMCCGCVLSDGRRLTPASEPRSPGGVDRLLD